MGKALPGGPTGGDVARIRGEMLDRYGNPPKSVSSLLEVASFRARARQAGIAEVTLAGKNIRFSPVALPASRQVRLGMVYPKSQIGRASCRARVCQYV